MPAPALEWLNPPQTPPDQGMIHRLQRAIFALAIVTIGRVLILRDRLLGRIDRNGSPRLLSRHSIPSSRSVLDAAFVRPEKEPLTALLICHGIGETVEHWTPAQALLARHGIASLVFNYSGYARSQGRFSAEQCEQDALAAAAWLRQAIPGARLHLLGFSLGTGVAAAVAERVRPCSLILCEGYTSFRHAACSLGLPRSFTRLFPRVWQTMQTLPGVRRPVLIVHGEHDRLFPVSMARSLTEACGTHGRLALLPAMTHSDLHANPRDEHWNAVVSWLLEQIPPQPGFTPGKRLN